MRLFELEHDETLRSGISYGTPEFPFVRFDDEPGKYKSRCIDWHWHYEVEFAFVRRNTVSFFVGTDEILLRSGDGIFINSGVIHRFESSDGGRMETVVFAPEFMAAKGSATFTGCILPVLQGGIDYYILRADEPQCRGALSAVMPLCSGGAGAENPLEAQINALSSWRELCRLTSPSAGARSVGRNRVSKARLQLMLFFISQHFSERMILDDIAAAAKISKSEALRCFKEELHTTPVHFLTEYRLGRAMHLLQTTSDTVTSVSLACGFEDAGYFCKVFRRRYGISPNKSRQT